MSVKLATTAGDFTGFLSAGQPRAFRKEIVRVGRWFVPHMNLWLDVTHDRMRKWVQNFELMRNRGVKTDLTIDHLDRRKSALSKRGEVIAMTIEGDSLMAEVVLGSEDDEVLLERSPEVSIELDAQVRDGYGNVYDEAITAVSIVRSPVIPGQAGFEKIAAYRGDSGQPPVFVLHRDRNGADAWVQQEIQKINRR